MNVNVEISRPDLLKTVDELIEEASINTWPSDISELTNLFLEEEEENAILHHEYQFFEIGTKVLYEEPTSDSDVKVLYRGFIKEYLANRNYYLVEFEDKETAEFRFDQISKMILHP